MFRFLLVIQIYRGQRANKKNALNMVEENLESKTQVA